MSKRNNVFLVVETSDCDSHFTVFSTKDKAINHVEEMVKEFFESEITYELENGHDEKAIKDLRKRMREYVNRVEKDLEFDPMDGDYCIKIIEEEVN